jgi:hypothetical protein
MAEIVKKSLLFYYSTCKTLQTGCNKNVFSDTHLHSIFRLLFKDNGNNLPMKYKLSDVNQAQCQCRAITIQIVED